MTDHITLPRAAAKRLWILISMMCRDRFLDADEVLAFTALAAAIAEPEQKPEPVAFAKNGNLFWCGDASQMRGVDIDLYLAPPQPDAIARAVEAEREAICPIVYGLCISDNNAQEIVNAIRARGSK